MGIAIFFVLAAITAGVIVYPLLPGRTPAQSAPAVTDGDTEQVVRDLRRMSLSAAQSRGELLCPRCGKETRPSDRFCVTCGQALPQAAADSAGAVCPSCGATIQEGDRFCAKCGHRTVAGEVA